MNLLAFFAVLIALTIYMNIFEFSNTTQLVVSFIVGFFWTPITGLPVLENVEKKP